MSAEMQTYAALAVVFLAVAGLVWRLVARRRESGCGGSCGAVSREMKELRRKLR
jgi:hypothetical protein